MLHIQTFYKSYLLVTFPVPITCAPAGRSLVERRQEIGPALISVIFSFLLRLSEVNTIGQKAGKARKLPIYYV